MLTITPYRVTFNDIGHEALVSMIYREPIVFYRNILLTLARSVSKNHALLTLHNKNGREVEIPKNHRILHAPGSHLFKALKE